MVGVLIIVGIIGYGIVYSGLGDLHGTPVGIAAALYAPKAKASDFPKPTGSKPPLPGRGLTRRPQ